jgi:hypothetical protein
MGESRIVYTPRPDATPGSSRAAITHCYAYLVERRQLRQQKEGGPGAAPQHAERRSNEIRAEVKSSLTPPK